MIILMKIVFNSCLLCTIALLFSCRGDDYHTQKMKELLQRYADAYDTTANFMSNRLKAAHYRRIDSMGQYKNIQDKTELKYQAAVESLRSGETEAAIRLFNELLRIFETDPDFSNTPKAKAHLREQLALCHLRLGEQQNCLLNHTSASCILPTRQAGFHQLEAGSREAIRLYSGLLDETPDRCDYRWLLNIAPHDAGRVSRAGRPTLAAARLALPFGLRDAAL